MKGYNFYKLYRNKIKLTCLHINSTGVKLMADLEIFKCPSCKWEGQFEETDKDERAAENGSDSYWEHYCPKCKTVIE